MYNLKTERKEKEKKKKNIEVIYVEGIHILVGSVLFYSTGRVAERWEIGSTSPPAPSPQPPVNLTPIQIFSFCKSAVCSTV